MNQGAAASHGITQRQWAHVAGGVGIVGLAAGIVFGLEANSKENQSHNDLVLPNAPTECNQAGVDLRHSAHNYAIMADVGFGVGALGLIGGGILRFTAPPDAPSKTTSAKVGHVTITPVIGAQSSSLLVTGSF